MNLFWIILIILLALRLSYRFYGKKKMNARKTVSTPKKPLNPWQRKLYTVWVFFSVNIKRLFRDRTALFFTFLFPLIFLFVFGSLSKNGSTTFTVAIINDSSHPFATQLVKELKSEKSFKIDNTVKTLSQGNSKMGRGELDATIELPPSFGAIGKDKVPSGQVIVHYTQNNVEAASTLSSVLQAQVAVINAKLTPTSSPFSVKQKQTNIHSLSSFDYTFTGLLGFAILGSGIFGPINVFPELKKMGILRRLHTTPLRVWQYFLSLMVGNAVIGLISMLIMLVVSILVFNLKVVGNYFDLAVFLAFGIVMILGIGLALGGWAKNERQVAPLANIIVFPMMFLSGVFFPRFLMPEWLQGITNYIPLTPVIDGARLISTEGKSLLDLGSQLGLMAIWTVIIYFIAFRVFRWE